MSALLSSFILVVAYCAPGATCGWYDGDGPAPLVIGGVVLLLVMMGVWIVLFRPRG